MPIQMNIQMTQWPNGADWKTYVSELKEAELSEVGDGAVSWLDGNNQLDIRHLLGAHQIHGRHIVYELHFLVSRNREEGWTSVSGNYLGSAVAPDLGQLVCIRRWSMTNQGGLFSASHRHKPPRGTGTWAPHQSSLSVGETEYRASSLCAERWPETIL